MKKSNEIIYQCRAILPNFRSGLRAAQPFLPHEKQKLQAKTWIGREVALELAWSFSEVEMCVARSGRI